MDEKDDVLKTAYDAQIGALENELESSKKGSLNANAVRVAMVVHGHDVDAFWTDLVKPGFDTAVKGCTSLVNGSPPSTILNSKTGMIWVPTSKIRRTKCTTASRRASPIQITRG